MPHGTSLDELYTTLGAFVQQVTGRKWWRKAGMQGQPSIPYALIWLQEAHGIENEVVELQELDPVEATDAAFAEVPWGTSTLAVQIELYRGSALLDATRLRSALRLEARYQDLWNIMGLVGGITTMDVSQVFRADVEGRAEVRFTVYANVSDPTATDNTLHDINTQSVEVTTNLIDDTQDVTTITTTGGL